MPRRLPFTAVLVTSLLVFAVVSLVLSVTLPRGWPRVGFEAMLVLAPLVFWSSALSASAALALAVLFVRREANRTVSSVVVVTSLLVLIVWAIVFARA
jgi:hypothetical protein